MCFLKKNEMLKDKNKMLEDNEMLKDKNKMLEDNEMLKDKQDARGQTSRSLFVLVNQ
jgi:hypothetical protein